MPLVDSCPACGAKIKAPDHLLGRTAQCPGCHQSVQLPSLSTAPLAVQPPPPPPPILQPSAQFAHLDDDEPVRGRSAARERTDACGVISLIFGSVSSLLTLMGCFTCGVTYFVAAPMAFIGGFLGLFGRGNMRVGGVTLNLLAFAPALTICVCMVMGVSVPLVATGVAIRKAADAANKAEVGGPDSGSTVKGAGRTAAESAAERRRREKETSERETKRRITEREEKERMDDEARSKAEKEMREKEERNTKGRDDERAAKAKLAKLDEKAKPHLRYAKKLIADKMLDKAKTRLEEIVKDYPGTPSADEARRMLKELVKE
jgi:hypothetical protein